MPKVLISDKLSPKAAEIFRDRGIEVDFRPGLAGDELLAAIRDVDGLAIRSATTVTADLMDAAENLKVVGRAGIGVDNVDVDAATQRGVVVMNTPFGNSVTTAEHAIAMMMSLARQLPAALQAGARPLEVAPPRHVRHHGLGRSRLGVLRERYIQGGVSQRRWG